MYETHQCLSSEITNQLHILCSVGHGTDSVAQSLLIRVMAYPGYFYDQDRRECFRSEFGETGDIASGLKLTRIVI